MFNNLLNMLLNNILVFFFFFWDKSQNTCLTQSKPNTTSLLNWSDLNRTFLARLLV